MQIEILDNSLNLDDTIHEHALNQLVNDLSNYDAQNLSVVVSLSEGSEQTDIDCKFCNLQINSDSFKSLIVEEKASDFITAIDIASERARRITLGRMIQQKFYSQHNYSYSLSRA
jgi:ribosome-associated translation inhibitor RaiA